MSTCNNTRIFELLANSADRYPENIALRHKGISLSYAQLLEAVTRTAKGLVAHGLDRHERVAIYLPKRFETVIGFFATSMAGGVFVPVNPLLKSAQVKHILQDSNTRILITSKDRAAALQSVLYECRDLQTVILVDEPDLNSGQDILSWQTINGTNGTTGFHSTTDMDMAAILYTSGSTGKPKGVVLSHRNMVSGACSVAEYLGNTADDRLLAVLPFSFDYGFSQLSTAFAVGACAVLMDYLLPRDVLRIIAREHITGLAAVPPLWIQLAQLDWPEEAARSLRYVTNSGGSIPQAVLKRLRQILHPDVDIFLMYGLTEAFRSTYLPPAELNNRPTSIGKAIPNAEVVVLKKDGTPCAPGEPGELVHKGPLVALGYWNDAERTAERFRPAPPDQEIAVWSGDIVYTDEEGYLYFIGRNDGMIKTSGYRVSPTEIEEAVYETDMTGEAVALGIPHPVLGQAILLIITAGEQTAPDVEQLIAICKQKLPGYMVPSDIVVEKSLPRNPNGKIDRHQLMEKYKDIFQEAKA